MRIVVTGFGKFNGVESNPTTDLIALLQPGGPDSSLARQINPLVCEVLEVSCGAVDSFYCDTDTSSTSSSSQSKFDFSDAIFIHLGVNARGTAICLEQQAWNDKTFRCPDERGYAPQGEKICEELDHCSRLQSQFPLIDLKDTLCEEGFKVQLSEDPGRFLCNYIYYQSLLNQSKRGLPCRSVFVHVPPFSVIEMRVQLMCIVRIIEELESFVISPPRRTVNIGFVSTANIASKNFRAISRISNTAVVSSVASRSLDKATAWAAERGVPKAYGSYDELLADKTIDAVYIPLPTTMHIEWVLKAAAAKKSVLCDKPVGADADEVVKMALACKQNGVQFMDGTMFSHHTRLRKIRKSIENPAFGAVNRVVCNFSFCGDESFHENNIRCKADLEPLGAMGDLGWYCIRFSLWSFNWEIPQKVYATARQRNSEGVPIDCVARLEFSNNRVAIFDCSFINAFRQTAEISGDKSVLRLDDFVICRNADSCLHEVITNPGVDALHQNVIGEKVQIETTGCCQEAEMWTDFSKLVLASAAGSRPSSYWPSICLYTQNVLDACMESMKKDGEVVEINK